MLKANSGLAKGRASAPIRIPQLGDEMALKVERVVDLG